jgi:hypothetical protein
VTAPDPNPSADSDVIVFYGGATLFDRQLASTIHCIDDEIIKCMKRCERPRRDCHAAKRLAHNWQTV